MLPPLRLLFYLLLLVPNPLSLLSTRTTMLKLPTELTLNILSYLPFNSLSRLQSVCKSWSKFCTLHENTIYRNAACLYTYIPRPTTMLNELSSLYSQERFVYVFQSNDRSYLKGSQVGSASRYSAFGKERDHPFALSTDQYCCIT